MCVPVEVVLLVVSAVVPLPPLSVSNSIVSPLSLELEAESVVPVLICLDALFHCLNFIGIIA